METRLFVTLGESAFTGPLTFSIGGLLSVDCDGTYSQYMLCSSVGSMYVIITVGYAIEPILISGSLNYSVSCLYCLSHYPHLVL